ncbi:malate synthase A [Natronospira bacteriovora]|uniref:malate synthase n=1 Tax=Natronospira bacteriovora TaxID=3069753 RepID=A0ABU0W9Q5_9GAMM|nr:malate synthase A [Natronospira sp. AB-CW4]MDQ2070758.1 malate synthase A [Natronospira sp. AB-CW4]
MSEAAATSEARLKLMRSAPRGCEHILSEESLAFLEALVDRFGPRIESLLARRQERQRRFDRGERPDFLPDTRSIREGDWRVAPIPPALRDRRVEITGPVDRKMIINGLNSGARVFMADFEDASTPTWENLIQGQRNILDATRGQIDFSDDSGKTYRLKDDPALLIVRVRGLHLPEAHITLDGRAIPGALLDFALHFFHNAHALHEQGRGPYYYLPKLEHHDEARMWADVFRFAEERFGFANGTIKATVLIETLPAVFQMHEILHAMRHHIVALNCGRWDYIFSYAKVFHADPQRVLPDRHSIGMTQPFLRSYSRLLIDTCHRRGALAMGGMAAQIPVRGDPDRHAAALDKVRADKEREAADGHDGTWVAHPGLIETAMAIFDRALDGPNQLDRLLPDLQVDQARLLEHPEGRITEEGLRDNIAVGVQYIAAWLAGRGCVPINHLMEDAATAEIARAQLWQWIHHGATTTDGERITADFVRTVLDEIGPDLRREAERSGLPAGCLEEATALFTELCLDEDFADFLTLKAYERVIARG